MLLKTEQLTVCNDWATFIPVCSKQPGYATFMNLRIFLLDNVLVGEAIDHVILFMYQWHVHKT